MLVSIILRLQLMLGLTSEDHVSRSQHGLTSFLDVLRSLSLIARTEDELKGDHRKMEGNVTAKW